MNTVLTDIRDEVRHLFYETTMDNSEILPFVLHKLEESYREGRRIGIQEGRRDILDGQLTDAANIHEFNTLSSLTIREE